MSLYHSIGDNFYLKEFDLKDPFWKVRSSLEKLESSLSFFAMLNKLLPYEVSEPGVFDVTLSFLNLLENDSDPKLLKTVASLKVFDILGFLPRLDTCPFCNGKISKEAFIKVDNPSLLCKNCSGGSGLKIEGEGIALLREAQKKPLIFFKNVRYSSKGLREVSLYLKMISEKVLGGVELEFSGSNI